MKNFVGRKFVYLLVCLCAFVFSSCEDDKQELTLPVFEVSVPQEIHTGESIKVDLVNKNNPNTVKYNDFNWSSDPDDLEWEHKKTAGGNGQVVTNYFKASAPGKYTVKVVVNLTNYVDGNGANSGKKVQSGETTNTYTTVSTLYTTMAVTRTIEVK